MLVDDARGVATAVARTLAPAFVERAARRLLEAPDPVLIVTGFYVQGHPETDGPPGALAIGRALTTLGRRVAYTAGTRCLAMLEDVVDHDATFEAFPDDADGAPDAARALLTRLAPGALVGVECPGRNADGRYLNMRGVDVGHFTPRVDELFVVLHGRSTQEPVRGVPLTIAIGDGGNEVGFGRCPASTFAGLGVDPSIVCADELIVASVSNWGAYALVARMSRLARRDLLPAPGHETRVIERLLQLGAVDGTTARAEPGVDGFDLERTERLIGDLRASLGDG